MSTAQDLDTLLAQLVTETVAAICVAGERDYLDRDDLVGICDGLRGLRVRDAALIGLVVAACQRCNVPVVP